jgi:ferredoxin
MAFRLLDRARQPLAVADAWMNRLYGWQYNPLYHTGVVAASLLAVVMVTGVYLLLFYRIGAPYDSVAAITDRIWFGQWTRSFHRYASDAAVVATLLHLGRMWLQRRTWGSRALAWLSGLILLFLLYICGWTGYVMVWDVQAEALAREGARWMDALPLFSEPIGRAFDGERALPGAFFFLNLFAHVALPVGLGFVFWVHVARVARPVLLPPRPLLYAVLGLLAAGSFVAPVTMAPEADPFRLPEAAPFDLFYSFFLPLTLPLPPWAVWAAALAGAGLLCAVPRLMRPASNRRPMPSIVDERSCTGCEQCWIDCPYEAIQMVERSDGRPYPIARVDPTLCTSCGICAGSCAPMGVGPPGRTGGDQLEAVRRFVAHESVRNAVVVVACGRSAGAVGAAAVEGSARVFAVTCSGNIHTSTVEFLVRSGAAGVLIVSCPPRDCWNREGPVWLEQRLYHDREAELKARVDRRRVRVAYAAEREQHIVAATLARFQEDLRAMAAAAAEEAPDVARECDAPEPSTAEVGP